MLDKLLEKPEAYRKNVALVASFVIGVAILATWLLIAGYGIQQTTVAIIEDGDYSIQEFKNNLPSIRQNETVVTELAKQDLTASVNIPGQDQEEVKSLWDKFLGR